MQTNAIQRQCKCSTIADLASEFNAHRATADDGDVVCCFGCCSGAAKIIGSCRWPGTRRACRRVGVHSSCCTGSDVTNQRTLRK